MSKLRELTRIVWFLRKPEILASKNVSFSFYLLLKAFKSYLYFLLLVYGFIAIRKVVSLGSINHVYVEFFDSTDTNDLIANPVLFLLILAFIYPLFEELTYRLLLDRYNPYKIGISLSLLISYHIMINFQEFFLTYTNILNLTLLSLSLIVIFSIFLFPLLLYFTKKKSVEKFWMHNFPYIFYGSALLFSFNHIGLFVFEDYTLLYIFLVLLPFFILGVAFGYVRLKYGFFYAYIVHVVNNLPAMFYYAF